MGAFNVRGFLPLAVEGAVIEDAERALGDNLLNQGSQSITIPRVK